ncbi:hypothetical protein Patl1_34515 [Pistacia atlantica]|uniref:Uncharacterized protein n=1 Tax=Pistacia atlantica TaxID=434234 RepID=A0ACC0ZWC8_9ROSI|nr:hypothetical protein Patl1_34515 [Pistacia atlantica]
MCFHLQGIPLTIDLHLFPLDGYEVVLGTQWLRTLGLIVWDFSQLQMKFNVGKREVSLQGMATLEDRLVESYRMEKVMKKGTLGILLKINAISSPKNKPISSSLQPLLAKYEDLFLHAKVSLHLGHKTIKFPSFQGLAQ